MPKFNFIIAEENQRQLDEIMAKYHISKSDAIRRGISLLHDYLVKDIEPAKSEALKVEHHDAKA